MGIFIITFYIIPLVTAILLATGIFAIIFHLAKKSLTKDRPKVPAGLYLVAALSATTFGLLLFLIIRSIPYIMQASWLSGSILVMVLFAFVIVSSILGIIFNGALFGGKLSWYLTSSLGFILIPLIALILINGQAEFNPTCAACSTTSNTNPYLPLKETFWQTHSYIYLLFILVSFYYLSSTRVYAYFHPVPISPQFQESTVNSQKKARRTALVLLILFISTYLISAKSYLYIWPFELNENDTVNLGTSEAKERDKDRLNGLETMRAQLSFIYSRNKQFPSDLEEAYRKYSNSTSAASFAGSLNRETKVIPITDFTYSFSLDRKTVHLGVTMETKGKLDVDVDDDFNSLRLGWKNGFSGTDSGKCKAADVGIWCRDITFNY